ncbi:BAF_HP2_G0015620.mRNA.1.CDS.1 [Saccharomyces cerevisiae]|nr:BAF_HP2_G0015620.mRNA.1.CDS.1 [Saccharomyces cerevisiae]CAI6598798.1 BAF_HP2_G0015620.mRNA.1.CDS.1 [Saccharomyces cerevisiae]
MAQSIHYTDDIIGSSKYSPLCVPYLAQRRKKKSSISRETDPLDTSDQFTDDVPDSDQSAGNRTFQEEVVVLLETVPTETTI